MARAVQLCYDDDMDEDRTKLRWIDRIRDRMALVRRYSHAREIEPGLLKLLRSYVIFLAILLGLNLIGLSVAGELAWTPLLAGYGILILVLIAYLYQPWLQSRLGTAYIAGGLFLFLCLGLVQLWLGLRMIPVLLLGEWIRLYFSNGFTLLFIPLLIAAWQFGLPGVAALITLASLGEIGVFLAVNTAQENMYMLALIFLRDVNFFIIGAVVARLMMAQRRQRYELKAANQQLIHYAATLEQLAISRERNRLARDLHDTLAHTLSGVSVQLEAVRALWDANPAQAHDLLERALNDTRSGLGDTRRALQDLRAEPIENLGLLLALEQLGEAFRDRSGLPCQVSLPETILPLSPAVQNALYRSAQEALLNIDRHANARHAWVMLEWSTIENEIDCCLTVRDDGQGFLPEAAAQDGHFGLRGMRERAALLGGTCRIVSEPGQGTTVTLHLKEAL